MGLRVAESHANFVWVHLPEETDSRAISRAMADNHKVLVRAGAALGRESALRVTCGTPDENERFLAALQQALGG
jgi:histidinol-phosphate aminotransferase